MRGTLRLRLSSKTQEAFCDQGCTRTSEPILDFRYVHEGSIWPKFYLLLWIESAECENLQGHQWYFLTEDAGVAEKRFLKNFGNIVRWNGPLGVRHVLAEYATVVCIRIFD